MVIKKSLSTDEFAQILGVRPNTPRAALCRDGHYMGIKPVKLPNRKLLWPAEAIERLLQGGREVAQ